MFNKAGFLAATALFTASLLSSSLAQQPRSAPSIPKDQLTRDSRQPEHLPSGAAAQSLSLNHHALLSAPPAHLKEDLHSAAPTTSGKNYSSLGLSKANFLGSTPAKSSSQSPGFGITDIDARKLWSSKHPGSNHN